MATAELVIFGCCFPLLILYTFLNAKIIYYPVHSDIYRAEITDRSGLAHIPLVHILCDGRGTLPYTLAGTVYFRLHADCRYKIPWHSLLRTPERT